MRVCVCVSASVFAYAYVLVHLCASAYVKGGVLLLDEIDVILHPLRSELNWPLGRKVPLVRDRVRARVRVRDRVRARVRQLAEWPL